MQALIAKLPLHDNEKQIGVPSEVADTEKLQADVANSAYWYAQRMMAVRESHIQHLHDNEKQRLT